jgi:hypothetical protein
VCGAFTAVIDDQSQQCATLRSLRVVLLADVLQSAFDDVAALLTLCTST